MTKEFTKILAFAHDHCGDDPLKLLLQQQRYPDIDLREVAQQLEGLRQASTKWPTLAQCKAYYYPPRLNREQSSSEATARHKAKLFVQLGGGTLADLTGGMGVDTYFMAQAAEHADYYEIDEALCSMARYNFTQLGMANIECHCGDSLSPDTPLTTHDLIYIDPARRDQQGRKVAAFEDCTPNLLENLGMLRQRCRHLLVKASPMVDLHTAVKQLEAVSDVYVVEADGECKEALFVVDGAEGQPSEPHIHCINLSSHNIPQAEHERVFTWSQEAEAVPSFASEVEDYLYEPSPSLMKGGCYNSLCRWFGIKKLARNTHLYTDNRYLEDFPGRVFQVMQPLTLNAKEAKRAIPEGKAHVVVRNYPVAANELQKKLGLREGGELFVIATTLGQRRLGWLCKMV